MRTTCILFLAALTACSSPTGSAASQTTGNAPSSADTAPATTGERSAEALRSAEAQANEPFTRYLGELHYASGKRYYVVAQFRTIQAAIEKHGQSRVTLRDTNGKVVRMYQLDMPEQLPTALVSNKLVFQFDGRRYLVPVPEKLPVMLCLPLDKGCF